ncbi:MarR family transcriptional regulator [Halarchaeum sp. P4]|uniref:MarR family transcriptional regulator n=1 Tax=Halarchaeum sp. P4 TaxID=3421639 RepID=UPI003EBB9D7A
MSARGPDPRVTTSDLREIIKDHEEPFVTASDIADETGVARQTAHKYLQRLHEEGELERRKIGGSAVIWWLEDGCAQA